MRSPLLAAVMLGLLGSAACSSAASRAETRQIDLTPVPPLPHTEADVHFMSGMIPHHAQALVMAGWAATHSARSDVRILAERITVGQRDEIALMQNWLRARNEPVPAADATHLRMTMSGVEHDMIMPGMLTAAEL
ncbi:MAG: DUF305 domain-containing protein, partial [Gemmatimonadetes bacterium]|nr:DUF305 domain-containing protein [Gemmatimonadota bacterium]